MRLGSAINPQELTVGQKLLQINWMLILFVIATGMIGIAMLYSAANGSWHPWASDAWPRLSAARMVELAHHHYQLGNIPNSFWIGQVAHLSSLMEVPGVQRFWEARKGVFSLEFIEFVESLEKPADETAVDKVLEIVKNEPST